MSQHEIVATAIELQELRRMQEELEAAIEAAQDKIKAYMGEAEELTAGAFKVTRKAVTSARLDNTALKKALPEIVERFTKTTTARRFLVAFDYDADNDCTEILDFFRTDLRVAYDDNGVRKPTSQYSWMTPVDYLEIANIRFETLLQSYQKVEYGDDVYEIANQSMLNMLIAYDISNRSVLLQTALKFSEWLQNTDDSVLNKHVKHLNYLQIVKRMRPLNLDEKRSLYAIAETGNARENCLVGVYLLLGDQTAASIHFANLTDDQQSAFKQYPIYSFMSRTS